MKGTNQVIVGSLEEVVRLYNKNFDSIERDMLKIIRRNKKATLLSLFAAAGTLYLFKQNKALTDKVDRLEEKHKNLSEDYHSYVMSNKDVDYDDDIL